MGHNPLLDYMSPCLQNKITSSFDIITQTEPAALPGDADTHEYAKFTCNIYYLLGSVLCLITYTQFRFGHLKCYLCLM